LNSLIRLSARKTSLVGLAVALAGCTIYKPHASLNVGSLSQVRRQSDGPIRVTAAVLSAEQSKGVFGVPVYDSGVQPVWLSIENRDHVPYAFFASSVDQNRFSPLEAAYRNHYRLFFAANDRMDRYFLQNEIGQIVPAGNTVSGFVYTNRDLDAKYAQVELIGPKGTKPKLLSFLLPVPGPRTQYDEPSLSVHYRPEDIVPYDDKGLREALQRLPCCTTNAEGTVEGDPLNIVFIGEMDEIFSALFDRQWNMAQEVDFRTSWKEMRAFLFGISFRHAPASSLYFYGRRQDVTIQKPRATIEATRRSRRCRLSGGCGR
jgi:hypothetical protein